MILTSLASVAVAAMFGMCMALCRSDFPHFERRENPLFPPLPPLSPPYFMEERGGVGGKGGGTEVVEAAPRAGLKMLICGSTGMTWSTFYVVPWVL